MEDNGKKTTDIPYTCPECGLLTTLRESWNHRHPSKAGYKQGIQDVAESSYDHGFEAGARAVAEKAIAKHTAQKGLMNASELEEILAAVLVGKEEK